MYFLFQIWTLFDYNNYRFIIEYVSCKNNMSLSLILF